MKIIKRVEDKSGSETIPGNPMYCRGLILEIEDSIMIRAIIYHNGLNSMSIGIIGESGILNLKDTVKKWNNIIMPTDMNSIQLNEFLFDAEHEYKTYTEKLFSAFNNKL